MQKLFRPQNRNLMDSGQFSNIAAKSYTLPSNWYYDPEIFTLEHDQIFYKNWIYQCHVSDLSNPGDYHVGQVADQGIIVIRGHDNSIRAFYNVCSHRAHPLLEGTGNVRVIVCPYHQWCYQSDGCFRGARGRKYQTSWNSEHANLKEVRLENYGGLLFVNLDPVATPLVEQSPKFLADMRVACPQFDQLRRIDRYERTVLANWKTIIDNNHECYHCDRNHKALMQLVDYDRKASWSNDDITFTHTVEENQLDNEAYSLVKSDFTQKAMFGYIWPTLIPLMFPGSASLAVFQVIPIAHEQTLERWDFFVAGSKPSAQEAQLFDYLKNTLIEEDVGLCEAVQRGLHSRGYYQGRFIIDTDHVEFSEHHVHFFQRLVHNALVDNVHVDKNI